MKTKKLKCDLLTLRLRNLIAAREFNTAAANRELQCGDGWLCDHGQFDRELAAEIDKLFKQANRKGSRLMSAAKNSGHPLVLRLAELARREHYSCEDLWYSCPKHPDGCANDSLGPDCNCGADQINAEVDAILSELTYNTGDKARQSVASRALLCSLSERTPMKRIPIKMRLLAAETELSELNSLFELQCRRSAEAHKVWQSDTGEQYRPDLGELLRYFMEQRALLVRLHALLKNGNYASDEYAEVMDSIERKDFCRHNKEVSIAR